MLNDCLLIALDAHMLTHNRYGRGPGPERAQFPTLWWRPFWAQGPGPGPYPLWLNIWASRAINKQYMTGNLAYYMSYLQHMFQKK